ncbi:unnamed protein product [Prorocentrum cordatum]|uniref:Uncharacterized protein n=1 Tax=Prorocentrum cordatum TaxID=2364126 RepID=A0ABN9YBR5_9DINO|nr:unnamed protein product [Polarella glacialis]
MCYKMGILDVRVGRAPPRRGHIVLVCPCASQAGPILARSWSFEAASGVARSGAWEACLPDPPSLHALLRPFSRRAAGAAADEDAPSQRAGPRRAAALCRAAGPAPFAAAFVLLARRPAAAEEPQQLGRADEECASVENMRRSPLIVAARCGLVDVAWLIARWCSPEGLNHQDAMGCSALRYAIVNKDHRTCQCLLRFPGLDPELPDRRGDTALLQAVGANAPAVCRLLLARRADAAHASRGQTALDLAEALGYEGCAAALRECGAPRSSRRQRPPPVS